MSVESEILRIQHNVANAYAAVSEKGGEVPLQPTSANLAAAVASIPTGSDLTAGDGLSKDGDALSVDNPVRGIYTQAEFDALTEDQKASGTYFVDDGASGGGDGGGSNEVYSTEETRIGTWIDGKPLYQKIIYLPNVSLSASTAWRSVAPPIDDLEAVCFLTSLVGNAGSWHTNMTTLPVFTASGNVSFAYNQVATGSQPAGFIVQINHSAFTKTNFCFCIKYTKTTDQEVSA